MDWGTIGDPYRAYYGRVSADQIHKWYSEYGTRLFDSNIRNFKGDTDVNIDMQATLAEEPGKFWYFNNGITILCNSIEKRAIGAGSRGVGEFLCKGVSVVNGAQTVGSLSGAIASGFEKANSAEVIARFISLSECPSGFSKEVTTATNTQNKIERRDFASLDENQERLKSELHLDLGKTYAYKSGDPVPRKEDGCTLEEAVVGLSCHYSEVRYSTEVKQAIGRMWKDKSRPPYTNLFNDNTSAIMMWNVVRVMREVDLVLGLESSKVGAVNRMDHVAVHGNRFILHHVFKNLEDVQLGDRSFELSSYAERIRATTYYILESVSVLISGMGSVYLNNLFKNHKKLGAMSDDIPVNVDYAGGYTPRRLREPTLFD
ncbi:hypothetical protein B1759_15630 [Rubrivirga sp. SAORIC476]|nr:hypothetical protein B1759_15630 [Rubrivirga sp. SAORIC476]